MTKEEEIKIVLIDDRRANLEKFRDYKVTIGIAPVRRDKFRIRKKHLRTSKNMAKLKEIFGSIHDVKIVDLEWLNKEGMFFETEDVAKIEAYFRKEGVDAVFIPHCNFARKKWSANSGKRWATVPAVGPRDDAPPPNYAWRTTDVQCGLFPAQGIIKISRPLYVYRELLAGFTSTERRIENLSAWSPS